MKPNTCYTLFPEANLHESARVTSSEGFLPAQQPLSSLFGRNDGQGILFGRSSFGSSQNEVMETEEALFKTAVSVFQKTGLRKLVFDRPNDFEEEDDFIRKSDRRTTIQQRTFASRTYNLVCPQLNRDN